jgi:hypothetical protein
MKNIHIIPTENYSDLVHSTNKYGGYFLSRHYSPMKGMGDSYQNIYITDDSEIKEGDWVYCRTENRVLISNVSYSKLDDRFKIILTTDQDLIKDGVQAIDNKFLEWFVKNPSCEFVEIHKEKQHIGEEIDESYPKGFFDYKSIIPQEEPKQETLEEDIKRYEKFIVAHDENYTVSDDVQDLKESYYYKGRRDECIKWKAKRMYSEEEVRKIAEEVRWQAIGNPLEFTKNFEKWFEQFKKK